MRSLPRISVIMVTLNEARHIADCIQSVAGIASEIIVLDAGSADKTVALAQASGARVEQSRDWPGFGAQKNRALLLAREPWVLSIDADERATPALCAEITQAILDDQYAAYAIPRLTQFCGKWIWHSGWYPDYVVRLFRRSQGRFSHQLVHERLIIDGKIGRLTQLLHHYSYLSRSQANQKVHRYAQAGAEELRRIGARCYRGQPVLHGGWAWWRTFALRRGFLDGAAGWAIAAMNARAAYLKYKTLSCLNRADQDANSRRQS